MSNEWRDLPTMADVAAAQAAGDEIRYRTWRENDWTSWPTTSWDADHQYRARPRQPKMKKVKSLCWRNKEDGRLTWGNFENQSEYWQRFPAGDIEGEVEDD